jgi:hypothetical protein
MDPSVHHVAATMVVTIGLWLILAPAIGAIARTTNKKKS